ncbi:hypothetical protein FLA4_01330 [Candidatus Rickettsia kotlanii]|nr:hypothetical protein FLA4_01330 [Candidatus Rickettsia kotlanii]BDU60965.1 hypothetical protein HM2_01330 [Candidatus Rickettsia kotlanii]
MSNKLEVIIQYYNDISNLGVRLWQTTTTVLASVNLGEVWKIWFCDKNFKSTDTRSKFDLYSIFRNNVKYSSCYRQVSR